MNNAFPYLVLELLPLPKKIYITNPKANGPISNLDLTEKLFNHKEISDFEL